MEDILLIGGGGHCKSVLDSIKGSNKFNVIGILDIEKNIGNLIDDIPIIGTDDDMEYYYKKGIRNAAITVGSIGNTDIRRKIYNKLKEIGFNLPIIIDKTSIVSDNCTIEEGTYIGKRSIVNTYSNIGKCCILNSGSILEHDCIVNDFVHLASGSVLCGSVVVGENTHIGANSTIIQELSIGYNSIIGAGSVVIKNIGNNKKAYGNPCREVNNNGG